MSENIIKKMTAGEEAIAISNLYFGYEKKLKSMGHSQEYVDKRKKAILAKIPS